MKPVMTNWISPYEAMITPTTIPETLISFFESKGVMPNMNVASSVTTAFDAFNIWIKDTLRYMYATLPQIKLAEKKRPIGMMARM